MNKENDLLYTENDTKMLEKYYEYSLEKNIQELTILYGLKLIKKKKNRNSSHRWDYYENILRAAIELNLSDYVDIFYKKLEKKFGKLKGKKLNILKGMIYESQNKKEEALSIYKTFLSKDLCNVVVRTRIVNLNKLNETDINKVIELLNKHLKEFPVDVESWHELGEIYLTNCLYNYALYCFEEIILHHPNNLYYVLTCAELHYTINQFEISSKYFCLAIELQKNNLRGLWGIILLNTARYLNKKNKIQNDNIDIILTLLCIDRLYNLYSAMKLQLVYKNSILDYLKELKDSFQFSDSDKKTKRA
ncbi:ER membrane protein complex subunit 2, putative [Hepatocystis sp. ex Piliocolobus tephrosceles]|nr:ER membrane protein complex subunit 2, putative [Hepatocystis sp. ex Piliocolobus tephrosceles]